MNHQETPDPQNTPGHGNDPQPLAPPSFSRPTPTARHRPLAGRPAARLLLISAAVSAALLAAAAGVGALVASDGGSPAAAVSQPAAVEQPAPESWPAAETAAAAPATSTPAKALAAAPDASAHTKAPAKTAAKPATKTPVKAAAAKARAKAPAAKTATVRRVAPAPAPRPATYRVVAGDTVSSIAGRYNVSTSGVLAANGLGPGSVIVPGQVLRLSGPAVAAPAQVQAPAAAQAPAQVPAPTPAVRTIYVAGAGGQAMVDSCIGPIHFTPTDGYSLFITEHDFCGGWARFSGISVGERVDIPGYGSYRVSARSQVPNPGTTNDVAAVFGGFPRAVLQTCIPGTTQMLVIALN
ncbi:LysM peptidoglycan-binding domain-containing protein [Arthrobacter sp. NPDC056691]|uniref:LysM peptidoglycan-binding domain-containing protein n=1 Tax=Arthrobacter sp. NPDC056691 TaxID=3345913 RepID=UPI00366B777C